MNYFTNKLNLTVLFLITTYFIQACGLIVFSIDSNKSLTGIIQSRATIDNAGKFIQTNYDIATSLFTQSKKTNIDLLVTPYPELKKLQNAMQKNLATHKSKSTKIRKIANEIKLELHGTSKITDKSPKWDKVKNLHTQYGDEYSAIEKNGKDFEDKINEFMNIARKHEISRYKVSDVISQMKEYNKNLENQSNDINDFIKDINQKLTEKLMSSMNDKQLNKVKELKIKLNNLVINFNEMQQYSNKSLIEFKKQSEGKSNIWTSADMKIRTMFHEMKKDLNKMNQEMSSIKSDWKLI